MSPSWRAPGLLALGLLAAACGGSAEPAGLLLVSLDTTRSDHLSAYGYARPTSPRLEALARAGARFEAAYAPAASTAPSHASLFTGLDPPAHGLVKNGLVLGEGHTTLAERLRAAGFDTAAVVSAFVLDRRFGLAQGFDHYEDDFPPEQGTESADSWEGIAVSGTFDRRADHTTRRALRWLREERAPDRPFFLFVHYFDPHTPYEAPAPFPERFPPEPGAGRIQRLIAQYDAEIAFVDQQVGVLLDGLAALGLERDTLVVATGDHGEGLMEHGVLTHGIDLYEGAVRVPLLVRWPRGLPAGRSIPAPVGVVDVTPTVLALLGLEPPEAPDGEDLTGMLRGGAPQRGPVFMHRRPYPGRMVGMLGRVWAEGRLFAVREGRWKYIEGDARRLRELYDLERDPDERANRAEDEPERAAALARRIAAWRQRATSAEAAPAPGPEVREGLEALGYLE